MSHQHLLKVTASGEVTWGPDPADVAAVAAAVGPLMTGGAGADDVARAALTVMHEREAATP